MTTTPVTFADAIADIRDYAGTQFATAHAKVIKDPPDPPPPPLPQSQQAAEHAAAKEAAKWQGQMTSALKQLGQADDTANDHDGYTSVAALMATTASAAKTICDQLTTLVATATTDHDTNARLDSLARMLTALGSLAPSAIWKKSTAGNPQSP